VNISLTPEQVMRLAKSPDPDLRRRAEEAASRQAEAYHATCENCNRAIGTGSDGEWYDTSDHRECWKHPRGGGHVPQAGTLLVVPDGPASYIMIRAALRYDVVWEHTMPGGQGSMWQEFWPGPITVDNITVAAG